MSKFIMSVDTMFTVKANSEKEAIEQAKDTLKILLLNDQLDFVIEEEID